MFIMWTSCPLAALETSKDYILNLKHFSNVTKKEIRQFQVVLKYYYDNKGTEYLLILISLLWNNTYDICIFTYYKFQYHYIVVN